MENTQLWKREKKVVKAKDHIVVHSNNKNTKSRTNIRKAAINASGNNEHKEKKREVLKTITKTSGAKYNLRKKKMKENNSQCLRSNMGKEINIYET